MSFRKLRLDFTMRLIAGVNPSYCIELTAYVSSSGLHGQVKFTQQSGSVVVLASLQAVDEESEWSWTVRRLPVVYNGVPDICDDSSLGPV